MLLYFVYRQYFGIFLIIIIELDNQSCIQIYQLICNVCVIWVHGCTQKKS